MLARPYRETIRSTSWLDSTHVAGAPDRRIQGQRVVDDLTQLLGVPRAAQVREVEDRVQLARAHVPGQPHRIRDPDLADQHPRLVLVRDRPPGPVDVVHVIPVAVGVIRTGRHVGTDIGQVRVLGEQRRGVDPDAVRAAVEPEPQHVLELLPHVRAGPVEVRLLGREQVQVPLAGRAVRLGDPGPGRAAEDGLPVVGRQLARRAAARPEPEPAPLRRARRRGERFGEPRVLIGTVIRDDVEDDPDAVRVRLADHRVRVREGAEDRLDRAVVGDVVAGIRHR